MRIKKAPPIFGRSVCPSYYCTTVLTSSTFQTFRLARVIKVSAKLTILKLTAEAVLHHKQAILPRSVTQRRSKIFVTFHLSKCYVWIEWQQIFFQMHFGAWAINKEISLRSISRFFFGLEPRYSIVVEYTLCLKSFHALFT